MSAKVPTESEGLNSRVRQELYRDNCLVKFQLEN